MKSLIFIFACLVLFSCKKKNVKSESPSINRIEIFKKNFSNSEVLSIDIVEIDHPMLGGIIETIKLSESQKERFLNDLDHLKKKGMLKCGVKYIVRLNMKLDTLRLKVCGTNIANRFNDYYYELENNKSIIDEYIK